MIDHKTSIIIGLTLTIITLVALQLTKPDDSCVDYSTCEYKIQTGLYR